MRISNNDTHINVIINNKQSRQFKYNYKCSFNKDNNTYIYSIKNFNNYYLYEIENLYCKKIQINNYKISSINNDKIHQILLNIIKYSHNIEDLKNKWNIISNMINDISQISDKKNFINNINNIAKIMLFTKH